MDPISPILLALAVFFMLFTCLFMPVFVFFSYLHIRRIRKNFDWLRSLNQK